MGKGKFGCKFESGEVAVQPTLCCLSIALQYDLARAGCLYCARETVFVEDRFRQYE